ncbi:MAG: NUDIX hydrolase [Verrucomicrobiota bacterium]
MSSFSPSWLRWCSRLAAIAQNGLTYAQNPYDIERYTSLREIAAEMLAEGSGTSISTVLDLLSRESGYATPKVDVRGVVFREDKLLLVQERADGLWTVPGGWADVGESPMENVVREVREEAGLEVRPVKLLAVFDRSKHPHDPPLPYHVYKLFIRCDLVGGDLQAKTETLAAAFFAQSELPPLSVDRITAGQVQRLFEHHANPALPTDLD